jgi:hypothetical protein
MEDGLPSVGIVGIEGWTMVTVGKRKLPKIRRGLGLSELRVKSRHSYVFTMIRHDN